MKIAVVGCGAVGSYYGARLVQAGNETHFLLRSDYEVVRRQGVQVQSPLGNFSVHPRCARTPQEIGVADLVIIALKTTANSQFKKLLPPLVGPQTAVLTLQNGLGNEEQLARLFTPEQVLGGLCFVCLNRIAPGVIKHIEHGKIVFGEFSGPVRERTRRLAEVFKQASIPCEVTDQIACAHWQKLIWNIPLNGLGVAGMVGGEAFEKSDSEFDASALKVQSAHCLTTDILIANPRWERLLRTLMQEVILAARAHGFNLVDGLVEKNIEMTRCMGAYKASTLLDYERHLPLELETMFMEPLRQAKKAGAPVPCLERMCKVLKHLDALRRAKPAAAVA